MRQIYFCPDLPHLLKNLRNALLKSDLLLALNEIVSFQSLEYLHEIQREYVYPLADKLTSLHLHPNTFQKMRVPLAAQALSNSVGAALLVLAENPPVGSNLDRNIIENTGHFIFLVDKWFDLMNDRVARRAFNFNQKSLL